METKYITKKTFDRNIKSGHWKLISNDPGKCPIIELTKTVQVKTRTRQAGDRYWIVFMG